MACMCAETFAAECGCGSKAAERYEAYEDPISDRQEYKIKELGGKLGEDMTRSEASDYIKELQGRESGTWRAESSPLPADPRVSPMDDGLHLPADSPALDLPRENAEIGGVDFKADSSPLPPDPRVSPLSEGLHTPSNTPTMAAEGNSYTNYQPLPEWPPAARHIITGLSKWERDESDKYRCGPVYLIDGEWSWCNGGSGDLGHIDGGGGSGPLCSYCGMNMETGSFSAESFGAESKFDKLAKEIAEEYEEKGKSPKEAMEIGEATAANIGRAKFGKRKFAKMGQKAESFGADEQLEYPCDVCGKPSDYNFQDGTLRWKIKDDEFVVGKPKISVNGDQNDFYCKRHADMNETGIFYAEDDIDFDKSKADEQLEYPCDVCGKPSDYNFQDGTLRWKIKDDEFVVGKPKISVNGDQNDFYCKRHADMNETGIFYAEDDIDFDKSKADEQLEYPCDVCGKPSDYNFQDGTLRWKIKDDEFVVGKPKISVNGDQNDFYCKRHADMNETGIFYAEDDIDFDKSKADRNKDGRISDWERAVGNKVAKGIRESKRAEVGPHVPTRIAATTTPRGVVKTYTSIPAGDGHVVGQFTPDMDYAPSGMYGAESLTSSIEKGFGAVLGIMSGLIVGGFAMGAVSSLSKDDENRE